LIAFIVELLSPKREKHAFYPPLAKIASKKPEVENIFAISHIIFNSKFVIINAEVIRRAMLHLCSAHYNDEFKSDIFS